MLAINLLAQAQVTYLNTYTDGKVAGLPTQLILDNRGNGRANSVPSPLGGTIGFSNELGNSASPSGLSWGYGYSGKVYSNNQVTSITLTLPANTKAFYLLARASYQPNLSGMGGGNITASVTTEKGYTTSGTQRCYFADTEAKYIAFNIDNYVVKGKTYRVCDNNALRPCYDSTAITSFSNISDYLKTITVTLDFPGATLYIGQFGIYQCENDQFTTRLLASNNGVLTCTNPTIELTAPDVEPFSGVSFTGPNGPVTDNAFIRIDSRVTVSEPGTYTVTADPAAGCRHTGTVTVTEDKALPTNVTLSNDGPLSCKKTSVTLTAGSANGVNYAFSGPNGFSRSGTDITASATTPGNYALVVTGSNGCTATVQTDVGTAPAPPADVTQSLTDLYNATGGTNWTRKDNWLSGCTPCGWYGVTCDGNGQVTKLNLTGNNLSGTLPASLSVLTSLQSLELGANALTGGIPLGIGNLTALQTLNLSRTQLGGTIPANLGGLTRLQNLLLNESALTGPLPASLSGLTQLQNLQLYTNQLSGCFPASYTALCGRSSISFANNPNLPGGGDFGAFCSNGTGGPLVVSQFPQSGTTCVGSAFNFSVTARGATSYQWYKEGQRLAESGPVLRFSGVNASNAGTYQVYINYACGAIQSDFVTLTVAPSSPDYQPLADLYTSTNGANWTNKTNWLTTCDVCGWQGVICANGRVTGIDLTNNNLSGTLPNSLSALTNLESLALATNQLTGTIPASLGSLPALQTLILAKNSLTGTIPASLGNRTTLQVLNLSGNQLSGTVPDQLGALTQLRVLNLSNNSLTGTLPGSLSALTGVQLFDLSRNQLTGSIPAGYGALQNTIALNINNNQLSGCFPTSLSALCSYGPVVESVGAPVPNPGNGGSGARVSANGINNKVDVTSNAGLPGGGDFDSFCASGAGSCNTAPVATPNVGQTATVGQSFSYTVNAFTDDTPTSLTYTGAFSPANGLTFNPITRIISGTPTAAGVVSVTITATDPGGLSTSTSFTIAVQAAPVVVTPLALTLTASPATLLTTGTTTLSATVSGGTSAYRYTFSGPGTISASGNTASVSNLPAGMQTFTVVVSDATTPTSQTITKTVSVTVNAPAPVNTDPVATANANQSATVGQAFSYTINAFTDAETPNSLTYTASINPANGLTFNPVTRVLSGTPTATGTSGVTITATDPGGLSASTSFNITATAAPVPAPVITTQPPAGSAVCAGTSVRASVSASGSNLTYQWYRAGAIVSGQTSATLTLNTVTTGQAGSYQAVISSGTSSVTASPFSLTVNAVPALSISPSATAVCSPQTVTLSATPGLAAYRWSSGQTTAGISVTVTGTYAVTATASSGCSNTATAQATINARPDAPYATSIPRQMYTTNFPIPLILYALPTGFGLDLNFYNGATKAEIDPAVVQPNKAGVFAYYATQTNSKGCVSLPTPFSLTVLEGGTLASKPADRTVCQGATTVLSVTATGSNNRYTWYESSPSTPYAISEAGSNTKGGSTASLTVSKLQRSTLYYCLVIGQNGLDVAGPIRVTVNANCQARLGADEPEVPLSVRVLGNPLRGTAIELEVTGAEGQPLRLQLTDLGGRAVSERNLERVGAVERQSLPVGNQPSGLLLLRVSTPSQSQTVKVLKVE